MLSKGRKFNSIEEGNHFLLDWEKNISDTRIHGTTKQQVQKRFDESEKSSLLSLPFDRFPLYKEGRRKVHTDGHIEVSRSYYSVPPEYVGYHVWVCFNDYVVRVFNPDQEQIAIHLKGNPGQFRTDQNHISSKKFNSIEFGAEYFLEKISKIGEGPYEWGSRGFTK